MKVKFDQKESFLKEVSLDEIPHPLIIESKGVVKETLEFRFITPEVVDGHWKVEKDMLHLLVEACKKAKGKTRARLEDILHLIRFYYLFPPREQMRGTRRFYLDLSRPRKGEEPSTWLQLAKVAGTKDAMELILYMTKDEKIPPSPGELLKTAVYREPMLKIPFSEEGYYRFRESYTKYWKRFDYLATTEWIPKMLKGQKHPMLDHMRNSDPNGYERAQSSWQESEKFIFRRYLRDELEDQDRAAERYGSVLKKAKNLYQKYMDKAQEGNRNLAESAFSNEFHSLMNEFITLVAEDPERDKLLGGEGEGKIVDKKVYVNRLRESVTSEDVGVKWLELIMLLEDVTSRSNAIKLMQRGAETAYLVLLHYALSQIYRKIRTNLSVPEKRAFILAHFRQYKVLGRRSPVYPFGGRIPKLERVIWDFYVETGKRSQALIEGVLIFKYPPSVSKRKPFVEELEAMWSRYLLIYPAWELQTRADDRERKDQQRRRGRELSLETPLQEDGKGHTVTLGETLGLDSVRSPEAIERQRDEARQLIERYCTPREAEILKLWRIDGHTEQEIAEIIGKKEGKPITQQAISKIVKKARRKIVEGDSTIK